MSTTSALLLQAKDATIVLGRRNLLFCCMSEKEWTLLASLTTCGGGGRRAAELSRQHPLISLLRKPLPLAVVYKLGGQAGTDLILAAINQ